jgi:uroporphyrin-3 C-methyltransferase
MTQENVATDKQTTTTSKANAGSGRSSSKAFRVLWILLFLALLAIVWVGWRGWQKIQTQQQQLRQALATLQEEQSSADRTGQNFTARLQSVTAEVSALQDQVLLHGKKLATLDKGGKTLWLLNEAKALASLAGQRLILTADLPATLKLLAASDRTLARVDDPDVLPARRALAQDMEKVRAARQVDTTALLLRLGALIDQLQQLVLPEMTAGQQPALSFMPNSMNMPNLSSSPSQEATPASWWQRLLARLPLSIHRYQGSLPLPLAPAQLSQVRLSLAMNLEQAQLALLQGRPDVYQEALQQAATTLDTWFSTEQPRVESLSAALADMGKVQVGQALPQIGAGLEAIKTLLQQKEGQQKEEPQKGKTSPKASSSGQKLPDVAKPDTAKSGSDT